MLLRMVSLLCSRKLVYIKKLFHYNLRSNDGILQQNYTVRSNKRLSDTAFLNFSATECGTVFLLQYEDEKNISDYLKLTIYGRSYR